MTTDNKPKKILGKAPGESNNSAAQNPIPKPPKGPSKIPVIIMGVSTAFITLALIFALFQNSKLKNERNQAIAAYNQTQVVPNNCQEGNNSICLYGKTTAVDDYLMIITRTLQTKPSTSYDIMLEVVPSKLAPKEAALNTDCRPNNHHLYICQRMTTSNPKKLLESLSTAYDNLNPSIEYNVSLILTPRATLIADDSQPNNMQMVPSTQNTQQALEQQPVDTQPPVDAEQAPMDDQTAVQQQQMPEQQLEAHEQPPSEQQAQ